MNQGMQLYLRVGRRKSSVGINAGYSYSLLEVMESRIVDTSSEAVHDVVCWTP